MKKIYVMGNLLVEQDSLPIKILPDLKKEIPNFNFIELDPSEDFPKQKTLTIIDTVIDIKKVTLVKEINKIQLEKKHEVSLEAGIFFTETNELINIDIIEGVFHKFTDMVIGSRK